MSKKLSPRQYIKRTMLHKKKGNLIIVTLITLSIIGVVTMSLRSSRLNLLANLQSNDVLGDSNIATRLLIDDANRILKKDFSPRTLDTSTEYTYTQAEVTPILKETATLLNKSYQLEDQQVTMEFVSTMDNLLETVQIEYPKLGTDYINYFTVDENNNLINNRVNSNYLSKAQVFKTYNQNFNPSNSTPRIYKGNILSSQYSYDVSTGNLKKALYVDIKENNELYNIKYPILEQPTIKVSSNMEYAKTIINIPRNFKELYIVFCNEDLPIPTGSFSNDYTQTTDILTDDIRDQIRKKYSYIRIAQKDSEVVVEAVLPIFEKTVENSISVESSKDYSLANLNTQKLRELSQITEHESTINSTTSNKTETFQTSLATSLSGDISFTNQGKTKQIYKAKTFPEKIISTIRIPVKREYKLSYRIFNKKNILVTKQELILEIR